MKYSLCYITLCCFYISVYAQYPKIGNLITNSDGSKGVVFWVSPDGSGGWMVALRDLPSAFWGNMHVDIPGLTNIPQDATRDFIPALCDTSGYNNTAIIRQFQGPGNEYAAQKVDFESGWYLPAIGQVQKLKLVWSQIKPIILDNEGEDLVEDVYWTSSELNQRAAWTVPGGDEILFGSGHKELEQFRLGIRPIRSFTNTNLTYHWSTGDKTPSVTVKPTTTTDYNVTMTSAEGWSTSANQKIVVNPSYIIDLHKAISKGESYDFHGRVLTQAGVYDDTLKTVTGCDSIYRLHLTVNSTSHPITIQSTAQEICDGEQVTLSVRKTWAVGDILCTDGTAVKREEYAQSGKTAKGVVFWISPDETHGWAVHLQEELYCPWSTIMTDLLNLPNVNFDFNYIEERYVDTAGYQNTKIIRESGDSLIFPAAYSVNFENGWYLPAARQVIFLQARIEELNKSLTVIPRAILIKGVLMYENQTYQAWRCWSSTEIDSNSVICGSNLTCMVGWKTRTDLRTRAVCRFEINEE